ncbi:TIGR03016 family PEP-CTERM system-associated outer membrane protein [Aquisalimonas asiatica]|uniref:Uncharacterized protein, PEP-CTERM system associated n=1 Tax=Aquisalimonas asiatica TaxID=406100 RepID=A0A1H8U3R0_9GAMM|nr:TIGR03016 family PEP-CTERM system-associated outer membrane protein [Aquisalimonas asiatica]SEO97707.1 uncharacterized protein, PEP-CTERM system associated [Aquisalimonas asiatica]
MIGLGSGTAWAQQESPYTITPRLNLSTTVTDNVNLAPPGEEQHDMIFRVSPGISARADGNRIRGAADYTLRNSYYARNSDRNDATHLLNARGNAELAEDFLFLDVYGRRREQAFSLLDPTALDEGVGPGGTEITTWGISPYVTQRFGRVADATARYGYERTLYGSGISRDFNRELYEVDVDSGPLFGQTFWSMNYDRQEIRYRRSAQLEEQEGLGDEVIFETVSGTLGRQLSPTFRVFGTVGEERNRFESDLDDRDGSFWEAGFGWAPTRNTSLEASYGDRFFGRTRSLSLQHRRRNTVWSATYGEQISTNQVDTEVSLDELLGLPPGTFPEAEPLVISREEVSIFERAQASVTYTLPRSRWTLQAFHSEREFLQTTAVTTQRSQEQTGVRGRLSWDLGPRTTYEASLRYARATFLESEGDRERLWSARFGVNHDIGQNVRGSVFYRHQNRSGDGDTPRDYRENAITASLLMTF